MREMAIDRSDGFFRVKNSFVEWRTPVGFHSVRRLIAAPWTLIVVDINVEV